MICTMPLASFQNDPSPWLALLGRCHPVLLHMPIGVLPATALLEFGALALRRPAPRGSIITLSWLAALSAAFAAVSGLVLAGSGEYGADSQVITQHKVLGIVFASLCLVTALVSPLAKRRPLRVLLLVALGVMVPTGHLGGTLTHGADFLWKPFPTPRQPPPEPAPNAPNSSDTPAGSTPQPKTVSFAADIAPLLERSCTKCHNEDKQKGKLLLTTTAGILKGGENGAVLVPGKPADSPMLQRCLLPLDDDDHMPPENKPQPTAEELALLEAWIAAGAPM